VHVPFAFTAGKVRAAGRRIISCARTDSNFLIVQNEDTHDAATLATAPLDIHHTSAKIALVFQRTERGTSLAEARWLDGTMTYRALGKASDARLAVVTAKVGNVRIELGARWHLLRRDPEARKRMAFPCFSLFGTPLYIPLAHS
jgi:hypothetical protein